MLERLSQSPSYDFGVKMWRKGGHGRFCQEFRVSWEVMVWLKRQDQLTENMEIWLWSLNGLCLFWPQLKLEKSSPTDDTSFFLVWNLGMWQHPFSVDGLWGWVVTIPELNIIIPSRSALEFPYDNTWNLDFQGNRACGVGWSPCQLLWP